jgi:parvulin-like peptidyl-prolyl isomerase
VIRSRLLGLRELLLGGADFSAIAMEHSEDVSAENGGDIGFFSREDVAKGFADAAFSLSPGDISEVVSTPLGVHLIEQIEKTPETIAPFETIRLPVKRYLHRQATSLAAKVFLDRLLSVSEVKRYVK